jgi:hypothetical protein
MLLLFAWSSVMFNLVRFMTENAEVHRASFHARRYESNDDEPQGAANAAQALDPG